MATANIKAVITAEDRASSVLKGFSSQVDSVGNSIAGTAKKGVSLFTAAAVAATGFAVKSAAGFEQTRIGLENMLGSADKAKDVLAQVSKFAAETPFEFPELAGSVKQLVAFGFSGEDAIKTMKQLGDVSAAIGAPIEDLSYLMGTLKTQGRAFTIDIRQFAQRGVPIYEYLAKVLNTNEKALTGMIEAGKVGFPEVQKAFELMTAEGGKFHGTMAKQSKSLSGLWSTLKDNIGQAAREIVGINSQGDVEENSIFARLRNSASSLIEWLDKNKENLKEKFQEVVEIVIEKGTAIYTGLTEKIKEDGFAAGMSSALIEMIGKIDWGSLTAAAIGAFAAVAPDIVLGMINGLFNAIIDHPIDMAVLFALLGFVPGLATVFATVLGAIPLVGGIAGWIIQGFGAAATAALAPISATMSGIGSSAMAALGAGITIGGAVAVAAAVAVVWKVLQELSKIHDAVNQADIAMSGLNNSNDAAIRRMQNLAKAARESGDQAKADQIGRTIASMTANRALGGAVTAGQPYMVGERGKAELFVPNTGGKIINDTDLARMGSKPTTQQNQTVNITVQAGAFMGSQQDARQYAQMIMDAWNDLQSMGTARRIA